MLRVYASSRSFGRASRIELCIVSLPMWSERTPKRSVVYTSSSPPVVLRHSHRAKLIALSSASRRRNRRASPACQVVREAR